MCPRIGNRHRDPSQSGAARCASRYTRTAGCRSPGSRRTCGCFRKVDQSGGHDYPAADGGWCQEISLDLDMVSAACPHCHILVEIPTDPRQPSMNLGQAAAVCLYELAARMQIPGNGLEIEPRQKVDEPTATSGNLDVLADLVGEVMTAANYSPKAMQAANRHDLRLMLRRLHLNTADRRRVLGLFRHILWRLKRIPHT